METLAPNGTLARASAALVLTLSVASCVDEARPCDRTPQPGQTCVGTLRSSGVPRSYRLYVPSSHRPERKRALVLDLHGVNEPAAFHQDYVSTLTGKAEEEGFVLAYPEGTGEPVHWQASPDTAKDVRFVSDLIDELEDVLDTDPDRVYAAGVSSAGGMLHRLACDLSDRIAAFGPVVGANSFPDAPCQPGRPVPMVFVFGERDPLVPWPDGAAPLVESPVQFAQGWADRNGAGAVKRETGRVYDEWTWKGRANGGREGEVELYLVHDLGHMWPRAELHDFATEDFLWSFFEDHPLDR